MKFDKSTFDFSRFAQQVRRFLESQLTDMTVDERIVHVVDGMPEQVEGGRDYAAELSSGKTLFFPFAGGNVGNSIACADGNTIDPNLKKVPFGDMGGVGYLASQEGDDYLLELVIESYGLPAGKVFMEKDLEDMREPMESFLRQFAG